MDYTRLYHLQDEVLSLLGSMDLSLYLTGGTALSRFYLNHRYSDDLDFFTQEASFFAEEARLFRQALDQAGLNVTISTDARHFKRWTLHQEGVNLKIDLVFDGVPRFGPFNREHGFLLDSLINIASNKIGAFWARDEARDAADLLAVARSDKVLWPEVLSQAQQKENFSREDLLLRMQSFPLDSLDQVPFLQPRDPKADKDSWEKLISTFSRDLG